MNTELIRPLTALRFYAAFIVFSLHASMLPGLEWLGHPHAELQGRIGVSVFFVLSGFIMTYVYYGADRYESTRANAGRFMIARITRIFPLHLLTMLICMPLGLNSSTSPIQVENLPIHVLLLQEWNPFGPGPGPGPNKVSWTLSCEMLFYVCTPFLFAAMLRAGRRKLLFLGTLFVLLAGATIYFFTSHNDPLNVVHAERAPFRLADYVLGIIAFLFFQRAKRFDHVWQKALLPMGVLWFVGLMAMEYYRDASTDENLWMLPGSVMVVLGMAYRRDSKNWFLASDRMVFLGEASFTFYMIHEFLLRYSRQILLKFGFEIHWLLYIPWFILVFSAIQFAANQVHLRFEAPVHNKARKWLVKRFGLEKKKMVAE
ncbi:MAG: acyltransferase [Flavobacteriales bacterium]|jgi:peptidoglycan/LPS O-acetylase OafA/YrhL|nr:acyltransferase [Flavobacteriales bacterium]MBK6549514.1 acyltransferase [Flavobacteriales bacterium]MBK6883899.1 acyltransferase [Flavobacteriales bacterium]MBK7100290.1 acyltransferase [Flavobacteriales bacterium]MBK7110984.1 acyltransferase [Flavobacteriales bacterium]